jgi:hypothetical protein
VIERSGGHTPAARPIAGQDRARPTLNARINASPNAVRPSAIAPSMTTERGRAGQQPARDAERDQVPERRRHVGGRQVGVCVRPVLVVV